METISAPSSGMYEVEKIINCKIFRNKKYYLIKWLCYPIYESTFLKQSTHTQLIKICMKCTVKN